MLGKAYRATDDAAKKAALSRAAFGRGGSDLGLLIQRIADSGGVKALTTEFERSGDAIDPGMTERVGKLKAEIDDMSKDAARNIESIFSEQVLEQERRYVSEMRDLTRLVKDGEFLAALKQLFNVHIKIPSLGIDWRAFEPPKQPERTPPQSNEPFGPEAPPNIALSPEARLNLERQRMSVLGDAATATERLRLRELELAVATHQGAKYQEEANRNRVKYREELDATAVSIRTQLGIATPQEREHQIAVDIARKTTEGYIKTEEEKARATELSTKAMRESIEAERVRQSYTPELTRFGIESVNALKAVDQAGAQAFRGMTDGLADVVMGTKDAKTAFTDMANSVIRDLIRVAIQKSITGPIAESLSGFLPGLFGGGNPTPPGFTQAPAPWGGTMLTASALGNVFEHGNVVRFDRGGIVDRLTHFRLANGGLASMAENDRPEAIMPLRRIDGRLGVDASGFRQPISVNSTVHNYAGAPGVEQRVTRDRDGGLSIETIIPAIEDRLADRMARGQGALSKAAPAKKLLRG